MKPPPILVLFSGGVDSTVLLAWAAARGPVATLSIDHPGRPRAERRAARNILDHFHVQARHGARFPTGPPSWVVGGAGRGYIPARNLYLWASGILVARRMGYGAVAGGHLASDAGTFVDARPRFFRALQDVASQDDAARSRPLRLLRPFEHWTKRRVVALARRLRVPLEQTWSCHLDGARPCGRCSGCRERREALGAG